MKEEIKSQKILKNLIGEIERELKEKNRYSFNKSTRGYA